MNVTREQFTQAVRKNRLTPKIIIGHDVSATQYSDKNGVLIASSLYQTIAGIVSTMYVLHDLGIKS